MKNTTFSFNISLSILNHLGRNLYRSFATVLGEAISNSWDADAQNVYIYIDKEKNTLLIKDDGNGMTHTDFQYKFLKIGYSKRKDNVKSSKSGRPYIGRKGIGKLALLSCAKKITIWSKTDKTDFIGGVIDNSGLDEAIKEDVSTNDYFLTAPDTSIIETYGHKMKSGTILYFEDITEGIKNRIDYIRKIIALYFRFSLIDPTFNIFLNNSQITLDELDGLIYNTQLLWKINHPSDPFISDKLLKSDKLKKGKDVSSKLPIYGFLATVEKPSMLKVRGTDEKLSVDLFVNGRLREKDIMKHIPTSRLVESYLYGQIHYNDLDDEIDRFTSSREGVVSEDPLFKGFLSELEQVMKTLIDDWDKWRVELKQEGDYENTRINLKERKSKELFTAISEEFIPSDVHSDNQKRDSSNKDKVESWVNDLYEDASFNFSSYGECFVAENLLRRYIIEKQIPIPSKFDRQIEEWKKKAEISKNAGNINFEIRENQNDLTYFGMDQLAVIADDEVDKIKKATLRRDAAEYKPIRDAMSHTSRLTNIAKIRLTITFENIKARIIHLLTNA